MDRDLMRKARLGSQHLEPDAADVLAQLDALRDVRAVRSRYVRRLAREAVSGVWRRATAALRRLTAPTRPQDEPQLSGRDSALRGQRRADRHRNIPITLSP